MTDIYKLNDDGTVTIDVPTYRSLLHSEKQLFNLEAYGVDNWHAYGDALSDADGWASGDAWDIPELP